MGRGQKKADTAFITVLLLAMMRAENPGTAPYVLQARTAISGRM